MSYEAYTAGLIKQLEALTRKTRSDHLGLDTPNSTEATPRKLKITAFSPADRIALLAIAKDCALHDRKEPNPGALTEYFEAFVILLGAD